MRLGLPAIVGLVFLRTCTFYGQQLTVDLEPFNEAKVSRLTTDSPSAQAQFVIDDGTVVAVRVTSSSGGVVVNIHCPNGQTINSSNVSGFNGTFST